MDKSIAVQNFKEGKIGIFPTDTAFGIGCRMDNVRAVEKVFQIRNRPQDKAVLVLVSTYAMAVEYLQEIPSDVKEKILDKFWPGGLTVILNCRKDKVPAIVRGNGKTLAIRMPNHKELLSIINDVGVPIIAPSANFGGETTPFKMEEVSDDLISKVDFVLSGSCTIKGVSTIIDCTVYPWKIMRQGVVKIGVSY